MENVIIYTDGSSRGNPGSGGWGAVIFDRENIKEMGGGEKKTTNNRMEMLAAIEALKYVSGNFADTKRVEVHTDSAYLIGGITVWIKNWQKNNWRTKDKREVLNKDLWEKLLVETEKRKIEWKKVLGHSGHELNNRCDEIATGFADGKLVSLYKGPADSYAFHL
jgi:ribonuclease HI